MSTVAPQGGGRIAVGVVMEERVMGREMINEGGKSRLPAWWFFRRDRGVCASELYKKCLSSASRRERTQARRAT